MRFAASNWLKKVVFGLFWAFFRLVVSHKMCCVMSFWPGKKTGKKVSDRDLVSFFIIRWFSKKTIMLFFTVLETLFTG